jgi:MoaA/NifB/PqqE/SkfB family radical SAM enzyme
MLSIIWNITNRCPWDCNFCVTNAGMNCPRAELSYQEKLQAIDNLKGVDCRVDLSGGEVMLNHDEHLPVIEKLSFTIGKDRVGLSCSGIFIGDKEAEFLAQFVCDVEMTMDAHPDYDFPNRPNGYHIIAGQASNVLMEKGVRVGLQTVITRDHYENPWYLDDLHSWLRTCRIPEWSLLKFYPTGRGSGYQHLALSDEENLNLVNHARGLTKRFGGPQVDVHYLMPGTKKDTNCRCVRKSIGILPNGDVTSCFWGLGCDGKLIDERFLLGNIVETPLVDIFKSENACFWRNYHGGCAIGVKGGASNVQVA